MWFVCNVVGIAGIWGWWCCQETWYNYFDGIGVISCPCEPPKPFLFQQYKWYTTEIFQTAYTIRTLLSYFLSITPTQNSTNTNHVLLKPHIPSIPPKPSYNILFIPPKWSMPPILFMNHVNHQCRRNHHVMSVWTPKPLIPPMPFTNHLRRLNRLYHQNSYIIFLGNNINLKYQKYQSCTTQTTFTLSTTRAKLSYFLCSNSTINTINTFHEPCDPSMPIEP